jgi:hypothetical protein
MSESTNVFTPYIHIYSDHIEILGDKNSLKALGEILILKAKLGKHGSFTFMDGINKPIKIISSDELDDYK